ncbi:MAG: nucleotidyltransferase family protein [Candidatus Devosia symbiotica]|nr:nucleotidyltransferase family protein [Candidatus Devosia symbiotica]
MNDMSKTSRFPDVMLLAAGLGSRLRPITDTIPKPLVPVAGVPLIERVIDNAKAEGARRFVANAHYHADQLLAHFGGLLKISFEDELLNTGGGIKRALPMLASDPILVMNTDAFWPAGSDAPIARMLIRFADKKTEIVLLCVHPRDAFGFARSHDFCLAPSGEITRDYGAPVIYGGVAVLGKALFADTSDDAFSLNDIFEQCLKREALYGVALNAPWFHVGDAAGLVEAERRLTPPDPS